MNAYEIADELQKHGLNGDNHGLFNKRIQNMLRQQADRIAELEKDLALKTRDRDVFRDFTLAYEKRIEELEKLEQDFIRVIKQTNPNKPQTKPHPKCDEACMYLCTAKPLSDEEIIEIFNQIWNDGGNTNGVMHRFARAIEAKVRGVK